MFTDAVMRFADYGEEADNDPAVRENSAIRFAFNIASLRRLGLHDHRQLATALDDLCGKANWRKQNQQGSRAYFVVKDHKTAAKIKLRFSDENVLQPLRYHDEGDQCFYTMVGFSLLPRVAARVAEAEQDAPRIIVAFDLYVDGLPVDDYARKDLPSHGFPLDDYNMRTIERRTKGAFYNAREAVSDALDGQFRILDGKAPSIIKGKRLKAEIAERQCVITTDQKAAEKLAKVKWRFDENIFAEHLVTFRNLITYGGETA
jgi:hypothetical protein